MNRIMREQYPLFEMYQELRDRMLDVLDNDALAFRPGGNNPPLGALCREIGEIEQAYIDSFKTFEFDLGYRNTDPQLEHSVAKLQEWYAELDEALREAIAGLADTQLDQKIDRGGGFEIPPHIQLEIYKEALLLFYGKASVYLKALGKLPAGRWESWVA